MEHRNRPYSMPCAATAARSVVVEEKRGRRTVRSDFYLTLIHPSRWLLRGTPNRVSAASR